jgi:hypothetical protein
MMPHKFRKLQIFSTKKLRRKQAKIPLAKFGLFPSKSHSEHFFEVNNEKYFWKPTHTQNFNEKKVFFPSFCNRDTPQRGGKIGKVCGKIINSKFSVEKVK